VASLPEVEEVVASLPEEVTEEAEDEEVTEEAEEVTEEAEAEVDPSCLP